MQFLSRLTSGYSQKLSTRCCHHKNILSLLFIGPHFSMDARERYGGDHVDVLYQAEVEKGNQTERKDRDASSESSKPHNDEGGQTSGRAILPVVINGERKVVNEGTLCQEVAKISLEPVGEAKDSDHGDNNDDATGSGKDVETGDHALEWTPRETLTSLITFIEASIRETLKPTNVDGKGIPTEIYETILSHVSDMQT